MIKSPYRSIPDTSDSQYWEHKVIPNALRCTTFVLGDKALHQQLKLAAWATIQASLLKKRHY